MTIDGSVQMGGGNAQIGAFNTISLNSTGLLQGSGVLFGSGLVNGGTVRVSSGEILRIGVGPLTNSKLIDLQGGLLSLEFGSALNNGTTGLISGRGGVNATSGITNNGTIALSGGLSDFHGALTQNSGAKTIVTGGSTSTFYDNVTNNSGSEFRVSTASTAVFLGSVTGLSAFTGPGTKDFEGTTTLGRIETTGSSIVGPAGMLTADTIREVSLTVEGRAAISADGTTNATSRLNALNIDGSTGAWTGKLDLNDNDLIFDYSGASPLSTVRDQIKTGFAGGAWNGNGITSSSAAAAALSAHKTALGYAEASALGLTTFSGQSVDSTSVLVRYTYAGDANLDGVVDTLDFNSLAANFGGTSKLWSQADFNYDGVVDTLDFNFLASNFGQSLPAPSEPGIALVPEPAGIIAAFGGALLMAAARRRRS
jgi:hypothetical protein